MARTTAPPVAKPLLLTSIGGLTTHIPLATVEAAIAQHHKQSQRDRLLPAPLVAYFVIALALFHPYPLREVLRCLLDGLRHLTRSATLHVPIATKAPISKARTRLGVEVLATLCRQVLRPLATATTRGAWFHGWRVVALDGTTFAVPDQPGNRDAFGLHGAHAFPLVRMVALIEVGTHVIFHAAFDASRVDEGTLAERLLGALTSHMLLIEDRGFVGYGGWRQVHATGAAILCRVRKNMHLPCLRRLNDGSYLSELPPPRDVAGPPIPVRVIEYTLQGVPGAEPRYRLCTSLLDPAEAPAVELAALYHERWEAEGVFDEGKTHLRGGAHVVLRSKTPELVRQELYGYLLAHFVVRAVLHDAARQIDADPDQLSFTHAVRVLRRQLPRVAGLFSPSAGGGVVSPAA